MQFLKLLVNLLSLSLKFYFTQFVLIIKIEINICIDF